MKKYGALLWWISEHFYARCDIHFYHRTLSVKPIRRFRLRICRVVAAPSRIESVDFQILNC